MDHNQITLKETPHRIYLLGDTYALRDHIRSKGGHWDPQEKAWWFGKTKRDIAATFTTALPEQKTSEVDDHTKVRGKILYKNRYYYLLASTKDATNHKVCSLDGKLVFWVKTSQGAQIVKTYQKQGPYANDYPTLGSLRSWIARKTKTADRPKGPAKRCWECGHMFTFEDARTNGGDWYTSYCGC